MTRRSSCSRVRTEGNLLAAHQELGKLALLGGDGRRDTPTRCSRASPTARASMSFSSARRRSPGTRARALRMLAGLRAEGTEPTLVLWALTKAVRDVWSAQAAARRRRPRPGSARRRRSRSRSGARRACPSSGSCSARAPRRPHDQGTHRRRCLGRDGAAGGGAVRRAAQLPLARLKRSMQPIGIFGGTFDPIHCGHLRTAFELWQELHLAEVRLLPTGTPPHRDQLYASAEMRLKMVRAAVADQPRFVVDDREVRRTGPVLLGRYAHRTARASIRSARCVCCSAWMLSSGCRNWHRWRDLLTLAHIVVAHRPGWRAPTSGPLGEVMVDHGTGSIRELHQQACRLHLRARRTRSWRSPRPSCAR